MKNIWLALLCAALFSGCANLAYMDHCGSLNDEIKSVGSCVPSFSIRVNARYYVLPFVMVTHQKLPHNLEFSLHRVGHPGFASVVFDTLHVIYEDGSREDILAPHFPERRRTFPVTDRYNQFEGVISKPMSFTLHASGTAFRLSGEADPFRISIPFIFEEEVVWLWMVTV